jgi:Putative DNA-binding domain
MKEELHLPWQNDELRELLLDVIKTGETAKVDFKLEFNLGTAEQQGELLKDISAFANTYDPSYRNHGFIIFGVEINQLKGCRFDDNADALQARIDDLIKNNIGPFISTQLRIFEADDKKWGVIVIPPTRSSPHVFIRDMHKRNKGDIYVRKGTITEKAFPEDFARFFRVQLEEGTYELKQEIHNLNSEIAQIKKSLESLEVCRKDETISKKMTIETSALKITKPKEKLTLLKAIDDVFSVKNDPITTGIKDETRKIINHINSESIPWNLTISNKDIGDQVLHDIENASNFLWEALAKILSNDDTGRYDDDIIKSIAYLAQYIEAPVGKAYTEVGVCVRYLPLVVSLYIIFIVGVSKKRNELLRKVLLVNISRRSHYDAPLNIQEVFWFIRRADAIFQTQNPQYPNSKWCDSVGIYIKMLLNRILSIDDPLWNIENAFFVGEFILCLSPMEYADKTSKVEVSGFPSPGAFLYFDAATPIIKRFLREDGEDIKSVFRRDFKEMLEGFDKNAARLIPFACHGSGFVSGAVEAAYPKK